MIAVGDLGIDQSAGRTEIRPDYTCAMRSRENRIMPLPLIETSPTSLTRRM
jgi:hypothetical protein